jgi:hypothetical protein
MTGDERIQVRRVNRGEAVESLQWRPVRIGEVEVKRG